VENNTHRGNYKGTTNMNADNQDMAFVNNTLEKAAEHSLIRDPEHLTESDIAQEKANSDNRSGKE
jgi:hypothetical protein